jgi:hypothetical protein
MYHENPYYSYRYHHMYHPYDLKHETLTATAHVVKHGLEEAKEISLPHALKQAAAISYLMGKGYNYRTAWEIVESWWMRKE